METKPINIRSNVTGAPAVMGASHPGFARITISGAAGGSTTLDDHGLHALALWAMSVREELLEAEAERKRKEEEEARKITITDQDGDSVAVSLATYANSKLYVKTDNDGALLTKAQALELRAWLTQAADKLTKGEA
jgi:hypothetical protein